MNSWSYKDFKIALCGAQGTGKTTLMNAWAEKHNVPVLQVSTRDYLPTPDISNHIDILKLSNNQPEVGLKFQVTLINERAKLFENAKTGFISDRSVFDSFVYYSIHNSMYAPKELDDKLRKTTANSLNSVDLVVLLSPKLEEVDSNGFRLVSKSYYESVSQLMHSTTSAVLSSQNKVMKYQIQMPNGTEITLLNNGNMNVCHINEKDGMLSTKDRITCIELVCNNIRVIREDNRCVGTNDL